MTNQRRAAATSSPLRDDNNRNRSLCDGVAFVGRKKGSASLDQRNIGDAADPDAVGADRLILDAATDHAIFLLDTEGRIRSWNRGAESVFGYPESSILGRHVSQLTPMDDGEAGLIASYLQRAAADGHVADRGWCVRADGRRFRAHLSIDIVRDGGGRHIGFGAVMMDLTHHAQTEEALHGKDEQFRRLVHGVVDYAIYMLDARGRVTNWNVGAERIKGYTAEEIIGQSFARFYTPEDQAKGEPQWALEVAARHGSIEREGWRVRKDGSRFWASVVIDAITDPGGEIVGFAKITRDVTERRKAQEELDRAREQLFQAQKMEAIGQLTGGVAHDFNNLLMAVIGSLELLRKRIPADPRMVRLVDNALEGAARGAALTKRMLAYARRQELQTTSVDLDALVEGMSDLLRGSLGPMVEVRIAFPDGLPPVRTDANQLETALLNLAVNARDAMPYGGVLQVEGEEVEVGAGAPALEPGRYVKLVVRDSGAGMDEETLSRAAEPFYTTKEIGKGTGLGLSMVHGLAVQSGGGLVLRSRAGEGTTAELWLPVDNQLGLDLSVAQTAPPSLRMGEGPLTIVAVDDDPLVLMNTAAMLEDLGHTVIEAYSAREALARIEQEKVDLVITDQAMPQMTGAQLAEALRSSRPGLPVIIATGYAELPADAGLGLVMLSKPFSEADLKRVVGAATRAVAQ
jgi:PAS domain S-box-containing protein